MSDVSYSQQHHLLSISTPLGEDVLLLQGFAGQEGLSRLFSYEAELLAPDNPSVDFKSIVGQNVTMTIRLPDGSPRFINGFVSRFAQGPRDARYFTSYQAQIVPWLWFLTRHSDCRIFQNLAVPDIITQIFNLFSFADFRNSLTGSYPILEYCVQYRETAFNFVSRLMEQFGIFYYFDHSTKGRHTLVMRDSNAGLPVVPGSPLNYDGRAGRTDDPGVVTEWHIEEELKTGQFSVTDYNFTTPGTSLVASNQTVVSISPNPSLELFDYPGLHTTKDDGDVVAKLRMQEQESGLKVATGVTTCPGFMSGYTFVLQNHYRSDQNDTYLLTEVQHVASEGNTYLTTIEHGESYSNHFTCIAASTPYRPARVTRRPFVQGPQPALVVGKEGEEIWVDKYGRVIVQFYWDRLGQKNENSSCWVRVSQPWAGENWGSIWIPRIGQEVLVSFLEGDPDRPIITGRVYNADQMPPYALPDYQTRSTFMSRSSQGGGSSNYNELRFEDLAGSEQIFMNAEKDMDLRVEQESREFVGANRHLIVTKNQLELVQDKHLHVKGSHFEKVASDMSLQVGGNQMESVSGNKSLSVTGNQMESVSGAVSLQVTMNKDETAMAYALKTDTTIHLNAGVSAVIEAGADLTLKVGGNFIDINPGGIFISGTPMVFINSGGAAGSAPDASPQSPASPTSPQDPDTADDGSKGTKLN